MSKPVVRVEGLTELRRALREIEDPTKRKEAMAGFRAAADIGAADAKSRVPVKSGQARRSVRAGASWKKGSAQGFIVAGKATVPYYGWLDFGSRTPNSGNPRSVGPWKASGKGPSNGRFIYPALEAKESEIVEAVETAVEAAVRAVDLY